MGDFSPKVKHRISLSGVQEKMLLLLKTELYIKKKIQVQTGELICMLRNYIVLITCIYMIITTTGVLAKLVPKIV